jgi:hypothetical protein
VFAAPPSAAFQRADAPPDLTCLSSATPGPAPGPRHPSATSPGSLLTVLGQNTRNSRSSKPDRAGELTRVSKVSNRLSRDGTRAPGAAIYEHVTALVDTDRHVLRAFGTRGHGGQSRQPVAGTARSVSRPRWGVVGVPCRPGFGTAGTPSAPRPSLVSVSHSAGQRSFKPVPLRLSWDKVGDGWDGLVGQRIRDHRDGPPCGGVVPTFDEILASLLTVGMTI